jgi:pimeloyl-ACP methyl ester carboxylesterase
MNLTLYKYLRANYSWLLLTYLGLGCSAYETKPLTDNDKRVAKAFKKAKIKPVIKYYNVGEDRKIATLQIGADSLPITVMLHGSPGSGADYDDYLMDSSLYLNSKLVVIDRPGYGFSDFGKAELSVIKQAEIIQNVVEQINIDKDLYWVGYSYGGPVAARLAMTMAGRTKGLLLLAASIAPDQEKTFGVSHLIKRKNWTNKLPIMLRLANEEKLSHKVALEAMIQDWPTISTSVWMLHGTEDGLIYYSNTAFAQKMLVNAKLEIVPVQGKGHGFFFSGKDLIAKYLKQMWGNK